ncbi:hypothetical protein DAPPUDRAFT_246191 [Daphnia pulex]|uniref:Transposase IS30-like HTH domain-containing protein n=1 Tax=Daphnia pulex TaxID=6669 RepID=E9GPU7_DAPPU|nr:hypothetical protein DAPPUDRAFT_246191 [Daphnia pulex]|eukprot:EFX78523.1 hypothetical protein DAPPUDRAFT_246191 [Daphnia pulex]
MFRENRSKKLTAGERAAVVALSLSGHSINQISRQIGCGRATVVLWKDRFDQTQDVQRKVGSGRPKITNPRQDQRMFNAARNKPITTSKEISGLMSVAVFLPIEEMEQDSKGSMSKFTIEVVEKQALSGHAFLPLLVLGRS